MSLENCYWGGRGNCPVCGKWCGAIVGKIATNGFGDERLDGVSGFCAAHGEVDLSKQDWSWDDFDSDDDM